MNTFSYHKGWIYRALQIYVDPPHIPLIKSKLDTNLEKYSFKIKLCRNATPQKSDVYEFIMSIVDNGYPEDFLILKKLNMMLRSLGTLTVSANINIYALRYGEKDRVSLKLYLII